MKTAYSAPRIPEAGPGLGTRRGRPWCSSGTFRGWWLLFFFLIGMVDDPLRRCRLLCSLRGPGENLHLLCGPSALSEACM